MKIIPAMLVKTPEELSDQIEKLTPYFSHFQVDIADGKFVPDQTISLSDVSAVIAKLANPSSFTFDFDLLVVDVAVALEEIYKIKEKTNVDTIFIHNLDVFNVRPNLAIAIDLPINVETIAQRFDLNSLPSIQVMSVIPGAQGRAFIPETLNKIEQLKKAGYRGKIYLDGAINNTTLPQIIEKEYRPDVLCIGSYLTHAENVEERVKQLNSLIV